ncbi:MAG: radical SAM protein [Candidatus Gastranaerophilaceae bacterium]
MATNQLYKAPVCELKELNNIFIEMTAKNCNQRCKHCYIDFPFSKSQKDFISIDKIKQALEDTINENIYCIYLTGAEPMLHSDFNAILRLCLKRTNVCICTNGSFLNEKKIRFLKKVEDEGENEIIFMLPLVHYNELKNDEVRNRGAFRQVIHSSKILVRYDFNPIFNVTNFYKEDKKTLICEFEKIFENLGVKVEDYNFQINQYYDKENSEGELINEFKNLDCQYGRILTEKGVYVCPFLANDHRGRMGADFTDYGKKVCLETPFCATCVKNNEKMFSINYKNFQS